MYQCTFTSMREKLILNVITVFLFLGASAIQAQRLADYVDPRIGSEGLGRTFIGPCCPYGMVKPSPDCTVSPNSGWSPMPEQVDGFAQLHVSGTGGGPKYGNILTMPIQFRDIYDAGGKVLRTSENTRLGYYYCQLAEPDMSVEITAADRASFYRYTYPNKDMRKSVTFDLSFFLGRNPVPKAREAQQYEDSHLDVVNDSVQTGWQRISGGWNNGAPYTVYFYSITREEGNVLLQKIGISFVSIDKARQNMTEDIPHWDFNLTQEECLAKWESILSRVKLSNATEQQRRMFYTALYHAMLMPVDRTSDNGLYDDYYAIWDTYRTSTPLITLLDPDRATSIASSLLNIYLQDGYMPDARSGNSNGRTQGGSNAEIVIADALAKGLNLNYELALEAMLKDATVPPRDDEAEGRGGLKLYNRYGYIPYGTPRAGNRTLEYSFCDWAIAQVARHLADNTDDGKARKRFNNIYKVYMEQSKRWQNLWRSDYQHDGTMGFIMPRNAKGQWLDNVPFGHSRRQPLSFRYTPDVSYEGPWYCAWWDCFFYEASSWEYSFSIPHDIESLISICGGADKFERRLDTFFDHGYYNVANEPSFLTPCLYNWIGKPELTSARVKDIINRCYNDSPKGLPGNDDSGSMSSWYAFHAMGIYPNAGHDYYLIHEPLVGKVAISLTNGNTFSIIADSTISASPLLNGTPLTDWRIRHQQILAGGELRIPAGSSPQLQAVEKPESEVPVARGNIIKQGTLRYSLHGQTRRFAVQFAEHNDSLTLHWSILRNLKMWHGSYVMTPQARQSATSLSYKQPLDGNHITLPASQTFAILSVDALQHVHDTGKTIWCNTTFRLIGQENCTLHLRDQAEGAEMWVLDNPSLPLIIKMINNPVEINWEFEDK